jgi:hypothetical protein
MHCGIAQCIVHSLYGSATRGPEDDSLESKHVARCYNICLALLLLYLTDLDPFNVQTLRDGPPQVLRWQPGDYPLEHGQAKTNKNLDCIYRFSPYRAVNTIRLRYKNNKINIV